MPIGTEITKHSVHYTTAMQSLYITLWQRQNKLSYSPRYKHRIFQCLYFTDSKT